MKFEDMRVGQLLVVNFPYSDEPNKTYGFRILKITADEVFVQNNKTGIVEPEGFGTFSRNGENYSNWKLLEDVP